MDNLRIENKEQFEFLEEVEAWNNDVYKARRKKLFISKVNDKYLCCDIKYKIGLARTYNDSDIGDIFIEFYKNISKIQKPEFKVGDRVIVESEINNAYWIGNIELHKGKRFEIKSYSGLNYEINQSDLIPYTHENVEKMADKYGFRLTFKD